ncbi:MAG: hypothetical protein JWQ01_2747 [Massilia sp.]|jgi:hypothetical protein|nr:hypothetical protein [Massilia sp.]
MSFVRPGAVALLALAVLPGCATLTDTDQQDVAVRAIVDHREVAGVGCVLSNGAGRWFVTAPGRVTIRKSVQDLVVDCKKEGVGAARESVASHMGTASLVGNVVTSAGVGMLVDRHSGAGFDYPATLTVLLHRLASADDADAGAIAGNPVY